MIARIVGLACGIYFVGGNVANAATFVGEAGGHTIAAYVTSDTPIACERIKVPFTYTWEGKRERSSTICFHQAAPAGKHSRICSFTHDKLIDPKIDGPIEAECKASEAK